MQVRRAISAVSVVIIAAACSHGPTSAARPAGGLVVRTTPTPFTQVTNGAVTSLIPDSWQAVAQTGDGVRSGFFASPRPRAWTRMNGSVEGMAATWVDATRVGVPSDYYYLAATGPLLDRLMSGRGCRGIRQRVYANHLPAFGGGHPASPGDYVARGEGTCSGAGQRTRWAYFVAAPGLGPAHALGIPSSGLYVVVAVIRDSERAPELLRRIIDHTSFGGAPVSQFLAAAGGRGPVAA
jgi:hypothetical protein